MIDGVGNIVNTRVDVELFAKWYLFPGLDLHTRCRYYYLPHFFRGGLIDTLDAGCGNGALAFAAYKRGNRVLGVTLDAEQVVRAREFYRWCGTDETRLRFEKCDLYDLPQLGQQFDQIICSETLEHIRADELIVRHFYNALRPGGILHLCCPHALHPEHRLGRVDEPEDGGHVRDGYTLCTYQSLLQTAGFEIVKSIGLGSPVLVHLDRQIRRVRNRVGDAFSLPLFVSTWPIQWLDYADSKLPFSLYVQAVKQPNVDTC